MAYDRLNRRVGCATVDSKDLDDLRLLYDAEILELDDLFDRYLRRLKELKLYDHAWIILMSDHGEEFLEHGNLFHGTSVFQETSHVPLIIKFPQSYGLQGLRIRDRVQLVDLMPTILDFAGIQDPGDLQGTSLLSLIRSQSGTKRKERNLYTENRKGMLGITHGQYRYVYTDTQAIEQTCFSGKPEEIYDLQTDPGETKDISLSRPDLLAFFRKERRTYEDRAREFRNLKITIPNTCG